MKKKIGFFGGSFDPIHLGHLNLIVRLQEIEQLDHIWICPVYCSVFKTKQPPVASGEERMKMIEGAIKGLDGVKVLDLELKSQKPCYTFDTLKALKEREEGDYYLMLGEDTLPHFHRWKEAESLVALAQPLIAARSGSYQINDLEISPTLLQALKNGIRRVPSMDVSSTEVRERLSQKLFCRHLVSEEVLDFIYENRIYYSSK